MDSRIVTVLTDQGPKEITAQVLDERETLAVHRSFGRDVAPWTLSHLPSGYAVAQVDHEGDAIEIGGVLLVELRGRAWRSRTKETAVAAVPEHLQRWLGRCHRERKFIPLRQARGAA